MIECILSYNNNNHKLECDDLLNKINKFEKSFMDWKNKDLEKVLESIVSYYTQWMKSYKILSKSSMNEAQKKIILNTLIETMNKTQKRIAKLVGINKAMQICQQIKDKVNSEPDHCIQTQQKPNTNHEEKKEESIEEQLAKKGVPMNIQSGTNLLKQIPKANNNNNENENEKYIKEIDGKKVLDLDMIIMEEASKKYWNEFENEISDNNFSRLFELLSELLQRLKKLSPNKQHSHLDDLMDINFIQKTIENGIDAKGFYGIFYGIWEQIKSLHSPNEDNEWQLWHDYIIKQFGSDDATWACLLSDVFNVFLRKMDKIEDQIKVINELNEEHKKGN
eukprot:187827_1